VFDRRKMKGKFKKRVFTLCQNVCERVNCLDFKKKFLSSVKIYMFGVKKTEKNIDEF
jgi:hypothetical protein